MPFAVRISWILIAMAASSLAVTGILAMDQPATSTETNAGEELQVWIDQLIVRLADEQPEIRDSAAAALRSIGRPASEELGALVGGEDPEQSELAAQILRDILTDRARRSKGAPANPKSVSLATRVSQHCAGLFELDDATRQKLEASITWVQKERDADLQKMHAGQISRDEFFDGAGKRTKRLRAELLEYLTEEQADTVIRMGVASTM